MIYFAFNLFPETYSLKITDI